MKTELDMDRPPTSAGIYAVICTATGEAWVGCSDAVETARDGLWADLRQGAGPAALQTVWQANAEPDFRYEELDRLRPDFPDADVAGELAKRAALWRARLQAADLPLG